jgi:regulator of replication initiation timing
MKLQANERIENGRYSFSTENVLDVIVDQKVARSVRESAGGKLTVKPRIAAIHEGRTRNENIYTEDKLRGAMNTPGGPSGMFSFLYPYNKPMIKNHDQDSEPTGRIMNAQYVKTAMGGGYILIVPHITDPDAAEKILDGRYKTVSVGCTTDSARCNICGKDIISEGWCGHERGTEYDGTKCGWILGNLWFDECSWVNVPADANAMIIDVEVFADTGTEQVELSTGLVMTEANIADLSLNAIATLQGESTMPEPATIETVVDPIVDPVIEPVVETTPNEPVIPAIDPVTESGNAPDPVEPDPALILLQTQFEALTAQQATLQQQLADQTAENARLATELATLQTDLTAGEAVKQQTVAEFHTFVTGLIQEQTQTYQLDAIITEGLDLADLQAQYQKVAADSQLKFQDLASYRVKNPGLCNTEGVTDLVTDESPAPAQPMSAIEGFKTLLQGRPKPRR